MFDDLMERNAPMRSTIKSAVLAACASSVLLGCAQDGMSLLTTGSTLPDKKLAAPIDPACLALQNRIALLQDEGTVSRVEKAATGSTSSVMIKRAALGKVAELNKANDEFRTRCSKLPAAATAAAPAVAAPAAAVPAAATTGSPAAIAAAATTQTTPAAQPSSTP